MAGNAYTEPAGKLSEKDSSPASNPGDCQFYVPFAGNRNNGDLNNEGSNGYFWSGTYNDDNNGNNAYNLNCNGDNGNWNNNNRNNGQSVRPVTELTGCPSSFSFKTSPEDLLLDLYRAYKDARRHKRRKRNVQQFSYNVEEELVKLRDEILGRRYAPSPCTCFIIHDPKIREIFAADFRDRIVHHLYYNYTRTLFERSFIYDTYSCIKGRGTHFGIERLKHHIRSVSHSWTNPCFILKMDIKGYFMHIDRKGLLKFCLETLDQMRKHSSDVPGKTWEEKLDLPLLKYLSEVIIMNDPLEGCIRKGRITDWDELPESKSLFHSPEGCGLPIGNLTSQLFSNIYMNRLDQYMKRVLKCSAYGRYVDDFYVVSQHKSSLRDISKSAETYLKGLKLSLNNDKTIICNHLHGVGFLGAFIKPYRTYIHNKPLARIRKASRLLGNITDPHFLQSRTNSYLGTLSHYRSYRIRQSLFGSKYHFFRYGYFGNNLLTYKLYKQQNKTQNSCDNMATIIPGVLSL